MAFHVRCNFNRIQSYAQALTAWEYGVIFRNAPALRGLVNKRKKHLTVRQTESGDIVLQLYGHDTVTWHKDNSVTIRAHPTRSTIVFANHCTPMSMFVGMCGGYFSVTVDGRTYKVEDWIRFRQRDNTWKADQITPWSIPAVNRERARQALDETGYKEFRVWFQVYVQMAVVSQDVNPLIRYRTGTEVVDLLRQRKWRELAMCFQNSWGRPDQALDAVRQAIYHEYNCMEHKSVPFLG
jgi:hypothetical protein